MLSRSDAGGTDGIEGVQCGYGGARRAVTSTVISASLWLSMAASRRASAVASSAGRGLSAAGMCQCKTAVFSCIAIHRKPHTVLRRLAVQPRTVFGDAPCLKLSVDGYICVLSCQAQRRAVLCQA